jgi:exonuclease VII large subunit
LRERANLLSSKVFDRLTREKSKLAVWTKTLTTAPLSMLRNNQDRLKSWTEKYMASCSRRVNEIKQYLKQAETRFRSTWSYRIMIEQKYAIDAKKGIQQGTRKLIDATKANLKTLASSLSSRVFDRLSIDKSKLRVYESTIKTGAMNEIKAQNRDLAGRKNRFKIERFRQIIEREQNQLQNKLAAIKASDPMTSLKRGFSLVYKKDNQLVKSVKAVSTGELLKTKVQDGLITSTVKQTEENGYGRKRDDL